MNKTYWIPGIFHKVRVKFVTKKYLNDKYRDKRKEKDIVILAFYDSEINTIYLTKELPEEKMLHYFWHEVVHMIEDQSQSCDEEAKCDSVGTWLMKLINAKSVLQFLTSL